MTKHASIGLLLLFALSSLVLAVVGRQQTLEKIPVVDFQRETQVDAQGLKQFVPYDVDCPACKATGETECFGCGEQDWPNCTECKGTKRAVCRVCAGKKKLPDPLLHLACTYCKGSGWYDCALCGGRGEFTESSPDGTKVDKPCGGCKKVGRFVCTPCEGKRVLETVRVKKKAPTEADLDDLREMRTQLEAVMKELEPFEPLDRASKTDKALAAMLAKPAKLRPPLKDMQELLEEVQKGLSRAGANYTNFLERQTFEYLTFRDRSVHLLRHDIRALDLCIERAEFNANVAKSKK